MKYLSVAIVFLLFSCGNKEDILLPKSNKTVVSDVLDHSPIYVFFRTKGKDTLAEVNRKNSIITTNWIFNIDKRLPLRIVIPEVMKLQEKKREEKAHKNEKAENYYAYADSIGKNMAFIPFTKVYYKMDKPLNEGLIFYFKKGTDLVLVNDDKIKKSEILNYVNSFNFENNPKIVLVFDKNMSFEDYLLTKISIAELDTFKKEVPQEFIF
ncbi:hypothetical protein [Flavobacterium acetivorans]|uniref:hypothetical protein n=1 Tax=Flavobacterium acetivorans TaxID=2893883 RepID=UPI001E49852C|nr:hypothetical protein [Flavobacterium sp. F-29]UFH35162.1 hypothetical protein LNP19_13880 [Flavobacterium sp. F-29]